MNIRMAREIKGCSDEILGDVVNPINRTIQNTLIISPPGRGKTTLLRDLVRNISSGNEKIRLERSKCKFN